MRKVIFFDSGVGGLSIWQEVRQRREDLECHYLFDNAYFPYGELDDALLIERVVTLIPPLVERLHADAVVVACNTASTVVLPALRSLLSIPVVGVVPAIKPAAMRSRNRHIAVLATPATIRRDYTYQLMTEFAADCQVSLLGSSELVKMAEQLLHQKTVDQSKLDHELLPLKQHEQLDVVVLGCTHFPLLRAQITESLGPGIELLDSGEAVAKQLDRVLGMDGQERVTECIKHRYYYTKQESEASHIEASFAIFGILQGEEVQPLPV